MAYFNSSDTDEKIITVSKLFKHSSNIEQMRDPLKTVWNVELTDEIEKQQLLKLIDFSQMNSLFDSFLNTMGLPVAIIDLHGSVLASSKWQRLCVEFHRANPGTLARCLESDRSIYAQLEEGKQYSSHQCQNGLIDCASPIVVEGHHLANLFIGQFFIKQPDMDFFKQQQQLFGFDEGTYFEAIAEVPVVNQEKLASIMALLIGWAQQIAARSLAEKRAIAVLASVEEQVKQRTHELAEKQHALEMANAKLQQQIEMVKRLSITDELTQLYNRRYFNTVFPKEIQRAARANTTLSFLTFDIDFFKQYNDHYGHQKGDDVLKAIGQTLKNQCQRASDTPFRLGGEEFGIIFLNLDGKEAWGFANKICHAIENLHIEHLCSSVARYITASFGLVTLRARSELNMDYFYKQADDALYQAKAKGKNRVICIAE